MDATTEQEVRAHWASQCAAMVQRDATALGELLATGFTLTHMTGHRQTRQEWLDEVEAGSMRYHSVEDVAIEVGGDDARPVLTARTRTDATIWGSRGHWRLRLRTEYGDERGRWVAVRSVASTW